MTITELRWWYIENVLEAVVIAGALTALERVSRPCANAPFFACCTGVQWTPTGLFLDAYIIVL